MINTMANLQFEIVADELETANYDFSRDDMHIHIKHGMKIYEIGASRASCGGVIKFLSGQNHSMPKKTPNAHAKATMQSQSVKKQITMA
jgi:hypothetical protein